MKTHALRLHPGQDLKTELIKFTQENHIQAGVILTGLGCLTQATLRMADETVIKTWKEKFEIVSLEGTLCEDDVHIHVALSNAEGATIGGHLKEGCFIYVTAEIVIAELDGWKFNREFDSETGFNELKPTKIA